MCQIDETLFYCVPMGLKRLCFFCSTDIQAHPGLSLRDKISVENEIRIALKPRRDEIHL
jgi:hypothetical protein